MLVLALSILLCVGSTSFAQDQKSTFDRGGFTLLLSLGLGIQHDQNASSDTTDSIGTTDTGLGGLNLGIGGFLTDNLALMFRASGTNVSRSGTRYVSGVGAISVQYWPTDRVNVEGGAGFGFVDVEGSFDDQNLGLILGVGYVFFNRGKHDLQIGVEYAPAFLERGTIHNIGFVLGYQLL